MKKQKYVYNSVGWWLNKLPMSARMKARRNAAAARTLKSKHKAGSLHGALFSCFIFHKTKEGVEYWDKIIEQHGTKR